MFNNLTITLRVWLALSAYLLLFGIAIGASVLGLGSARDSLAHVHGERMVTAASLATLRSNYLHNRIEGLLLFQHAPDSPTLALHGHPVTLHFDNIRAGREANEAALKQINGRIVSPEEQVLIDDLLAKLKDWQVKRDQFLDAVRNNDFSVATMQFFLVAGRTQGLAFERSIVALYEHQAAMAKIETVKSERNHYFNQMLFVAIVMFGILPTGVLLLVTMRRMKNGLAQAKRNAASIASGDLSLDIQPPSGNDEIAHLLTQNNLMQDNLRQLIRQVLVSADSIASASAQVAVGTQDLSQRTEQQASALEQTAAATEELNSTVNHNATSAQQARRMADAASGVAVCGGAVVAKVVETMSGIQSSSRKISDIISVIDGIAFQTNILALNAAVEAARAGQQGRGFAVVADEVRSLAKRSAEAAKEIKTLISDSVNKVSGGTEQVDQAGRTMAQIVASIGGVTQIMNEIATASAEQANGLGQINSAVAQMDGVTQQNAALVEQASAAAASLRDQAQYLKELVGRFRI